MEFSDSTLPSRTPAPVSVERVMADLPLFAPAGRSGTGRLADVGFSPLHDHVLECTARYRVAEAEGTGLEVTTRRWPDVDWPPLRDHVRRFGSGHDFLQRRAEGDTDAEPRVHPLGASWSRARIGIDGAPYDCDVLHSPYAWAAVAMVEPHFVVRVAALRAPDAPPALERVRNASEIAPPPRGG
ncbi:hypothetical protein BJF83_12400 [Nocardiopsis sp. CNR-923]|uniref:hypothetical protein n=1 Tax=Nocardiopsis sp. CNR-923 TaxID=1904965 RepID=UPI00095BA6C1|nr:hypothetical protein [Nocardiopsis sp. CNR-923]OLT29237.1 hypothetical protein BJF83_12400 [Nocardiopsis sp. CNR-923]